MKTRLLVLMAALAFSVSNLTAQYCGNSGSSVCMPSGTITEPGLMKSEDIPCVRRNTATDLVLQFKNFNVFTFNGTDITINSLKFDSISNLPAGLCWASNKSDNTFQNQEDGCFRITGTTLAPVGQYKLKIYLTMNTNIGTIGPNLDAETVGIDVYIRLLNTNAGICPPVDTNQTQPFAEFPVNFDSIAHVTGAVYIDRNSNNLLDAADTRISNARIGIGNDVALTNTNGVYNFYLPAGNYAVAPAAGNIAAYTFVPGSIAVNAPQVGVEYGNNNFQVTVPANYCEANIWLVNTFMPPRPGFQNEMGLGLNNNFSASPTSGTVRLHYDSLQSYLSASPSPALIDTVARIVEWNVVNLSEGDQWYAMIYMYTPQTVALGTILSNSVEVISSSCASLDSIFAVNEEEVVGSYDPNDKAISPVGYGSWNGVNPDKHPDFTYKVRFQNTGTFLAENVVLVDTMSPHLDLTTLKVLSASHDFEVTIGNDRAVKFIFNQIMLPDSNSNEPGSHGYVQYSIKPYPGLAQNVEITNRADIYFDFNEPVLTNTTLTTVDYVDHTVGIKEISPVYNFALYPNPTTGNVQLTADEQLVGKQLKVTDISGRVLLQRMVDAPVMTIQLSELANGIYLIQIEGTTKKLVKE